MIWVGARLWDPQPVVRFVKAEAPTKPDLVTGQDRRVGRDLTRTQT